MIIAYLKGFNATMFDEVNKPSEVHKARPVNSCWQIFLVGVLLYFTGLVILVETGNALLFPLVAFLGSFTVPISYVAFFYDRRTSSTLRIETVALCFLYGGVIGSFAASLLEPLFVQKFGLLPGIQIGLIEELAKILGVILIARHTRHTSMVTGIILGAAAGMGFAAFESNGYSFVTFMKTNGNLVALTDVTVLRGLLAPIGHGTWTAILAAVLFRQSTPERLEYDSKVIWAYITVSVLHGLWDSVPALWAAIPMIREAFAFQELFNLGSLALIGVIGLIILARLWKKSKTQWSVLAAEDEEILMP